MLQVKELSKVYEGKVPYRALSNINITTEKGEFVGIMGPSGSGKTTLLNVIATIDDPTTGEVLINGEDPHRLSRNKLAKFRRRELGFVFQDFNLLNTLTVEENIVLPLTLDNKNVKEMKASAAKIAETLGITEILNKRTYEISGGQAQRVAVARAMIRNPSLVLADEPTGNLDSKASKDVMELLSLMNKTHGTTTMLVTHDAQAASYCDRVIFIRDGSLYSEIHKGDSRQVFFQKIIDTLSLMGEMTMNFRQFAFNNVFRNKRLYVAYFLSSLFTVMVFFTFANFAFHPVLSGDEMNANVIIGMTVAGGIIYVFSFFFILYSMSSFLQSRKKEFGLLMIQGMSSYQIRWMVFLENMIIGLFSTVIGIGLGVLFSKAILLIADNVLIIGENLNFYFPMKAIVITFVSFVILFLFISFFVTFILRTNKLIDLIKGDKIGKSEPKASITLTILAIILLGSGYAIALSVKGLSVVVALLPVAILVTLGTYLLFSQMSVFVIGRLKKNKRLFWKKTNMLLFSDLSYRMKDNARAFFIVAIISTVAFSAIGTLVGLNSYLTKGLIESNPVSFVYYPSGSASPEEDENLDLIEQTIAKYDLGVDRVQLDLRYFKQGADDREVLIVTADDYNAYARLINEKVITLEKGEAIPVENSVRVLDAMASQDNSMLRELTLGDGATIAVNHDKIGLAKPDVLPEMWGYYIVSDDIYEQLADPVDIESPYAWNVKEGRQEDVVAAGEKILNDIQGQFYAIDFIVYEINKMFGPILFVGLFIGIIFFVSAGSFLYFRLYTDLDDDKAKFTAISKIGLTDGELRKVVSRQTALLFFTPIMVALVHGAVALTALSHMFEYDLRQESVLVLGSFLVIQVVYYFVVRHFYTKQIIGAIR